MESPDFYIWYIENKIPDIEYSQIPRSLRDFWADHYKKLDDEHKRIYRRMYRGIQ